MNTGFFKSNGRISKGYVYDSDINMNGKVITVHGTPVNGLDVVNKNYCDNNTSGSSVPFFNFTLSGVAWTTVLNDQEGVYQIFIKNGMNNGPSATFNISKSSSGRQASIVRWTSSHGLTTEERIELRWLPNSGIEIRKNKTGYDGTYTIKYIEV